MHLFLNSIRQRLATPKKANFCLLFEIRVFGENPARFFSTAFSSTFRKSTKLLCEIISVHLLKSVICLKLSGFDMSFFLDEKRNKKIKAAQNFGNNVRLNRYILENIVTS